MTTTSEAARTAGAMLFNTGFEGTTHLSAAAGPYFHGHPEQYEDFRGNDPTVPAPNDWARIAAHPVLGTLRIYHEGGDESQRFARVVPDEADPTNRVLRFWIGRPNVAVREPAVLHPKARVQAELYGNTGLRELYQSVRVRFHPDFALLKQFPHSFSWLTIAEFWNKPFWSEISDDAPMPFPFRISLGIKKLAAGPVDALYFGVDSQMMASPPPNFQVRKVWHDTNTAFAVPISSWMTLDTYYREGDNDTGRFFCAVTPDNAPRQILFDIRNWTYHPENHAPDGLTHYNPMKLYTSASIAEFLRDQGAALQVDWDDFSLWSNRAPEDGGA